MAVITPSHQIFTEAVTRLADCPAAAIPYRQAQLSIRGLAGIQALATAEVLADIHAEFWNDHVGELVNGTVYSFSATAAHQVSQTTDVVPDALWTPALFSAAINYYLAAKAVGYYPLTTKREHTVTQNIEEALRSLELMAQSDEERLRAPVDTFRQLWGKELLPPDQAETVLALY